MKIGISNLLIISYAVISYYTISLEDSSTEV